MYNRTKNQVILFEPDSDFLGDIIDDSIDDSSNYNYIQPLEGCIEYVSVFGDSKTITAKSFIEYSINCYASNKFLNNFETDKKIISKKHVFQFEYDYDKYSEIHLQEVSAFIFKDKIHLMTKNIETKSIHIDGDFSNEIYSDLMKYVREHNVLKNKQVFISEDGNGLSYKLKKPINITLNEVILNDKIKEDIYDNVIFHFKELEGSNGIILYGEPGTGKSITISAITNEVINEGYSVCYITDNINFIQLEDFIDKMLAPCLIIFEDMDSMGQNRRDIVNTQIAPLLQMINGLAEKNNKQIFIGTTNHIEHLDAALSNRPVRFNRKIKFDFATDSEIDKLIDLYFEDEKITDENKKLCYNKKFTGSHIKELKRTCEMHVKKYKKKYNEIFSECADIIRENFSTGGMKLGF